jgi:multiple sugar transport system permease protein
MSTTTVLEREFKITTATREKPESNKKFLSILLTPALLIFAFAILIPIFIGIYISFTNSSAPTGYLGTHVTYANYYYLLNNIYYTDFWRYTYQTLFFSIVSLIIEFVLGLTFALILNKNFKGRGIARTTLLIPWAIPTVASATIYRHEIFNPAGTPYFGLVNSILQLLGLRPVSFFGPDAPVLFTLFGPVPYGTHIEAIPITLTMMVAIVIDVWKTTPFITLLILAALQIVPEDLYKAGDIAGASGWQKFRYISWPLIKPGVGIALIFRAMEALRVYDAIVVFNDDSVHSLTWKAVNLWLQGDYGVASAISVMLLLFVVIFAFFILYFTRRREKERKSSSIWLGLIVALVIIYILFTNMQTFGVTNTIIGIVIVGTIYVIVFLRNVIKNFGIRTRSIIGQGIRKTNAKPFSESSDFEKKDLDITQKNVDDQSRIDGLKNIAQKQDELPSSIMSLKLERKSIMVSERKVKWYIGTRYVKKVLFVVAVVVMCLFCAGPFIWVVLRSFRNPYNSVLQTSFELFPKYLSLDAYKLLFTNTQVYGTTFQTPLINGFILSGLTALVVIVAGVFIAYAIARFNFPLKRILNSFIFSMNSLPPLIIVIPFYIQTTLIASFLPPVNLGSSYVNNMVNQLFRLILPYAAFNLPLAVFILVAFFQEIPGDLWKAAKVDGASNFQVLRKIVLPLTIPGIFTVAILVFIASWNELLFAQVFLIDPNVQTVPRTILRYVQNPGSLMATWNTDIVLLAATVISTIPLVIIVLIFQKNIISGLTRGAVKG